MTKWKLCYFCSCYFSNVLCEAVGLCEGCPLSQILFVMFRDKINVQIGWGECLGWYCNIGIVSVHVLASSCHYSIFSMLCHAVQPNVEWLWRNQCEAMVLRWSAPSWLGVADPKKFKYVRVWSMRWTCVLVAQTSRSAFFHFCNIGKISPFICYFQAGLL